MKKKLPLIILCGKSGSGKSTVAKYLTEKYGLKEIKSYTTREKRYEDEDTHIFVDKNEYEKQKAAGNIIAETYFAGNYYFTTKSQIEENDLVVWDKTGIEEYKELQKTQNVRDCEIFYIDTPKEELIRRMQKRGDSSEMIKQRIEHDEIAFRGCKELCNKIVDGTQRWNFIGDSILSWTKWVAPLEPKTWYFISGRLVPGSIPGNVKLYEAIETQTKDECNTYFRVDRELTEEELAKYKIEKRRPNQTNEELDENEEYTQDENMGMDLC